MRHKKSGRKLGRARPHRKALLNNLARSLLIKGRIKTTEAKAKEVVRLADKLITLGKKGGLSSRREAARVIKDKKIIARLFEEIAPRFSTRKGGYTRVIKLLPRLGDGASLALVELVEKPEEKKKPLEKKKKEKKAQTK